MLINATQHHGPAIWFGIMLIVVVCWGVWLNTAWPSLKVARLSVVALVSFGGALFALIISLG